MHRRSHFTIKLYGISACEINSKCSVFPRCGNIRVCRDIDLSAFMSTLCTLTHSQLDNLERSLLLHPPLPSHVHPSHLHTLTHSHCSITLSASSASSSTLPSHHTSTLHILTPSHCSITLSASSASSSTLPSPPLTRPPFISSHNHTAR